MRKAAPSRRRLITAAAGALALVASVALSATGAQGQILTASRSTTSVAEPAVAGGCAIEVASARAVVPDLPAGLPCPKKTNGTYKIAMLEVGDCPYCDALASEYRPQAKALGLDVTYYDGRLDAPTQSQQMTEAIATHPNLIIVVPVDIASIVPAIAQAKIAHIPVLDATIEVAPDGLKYVVGYEGLIDANAGAADARLMVTALKSEGDSGDVGVIEGPAGGSAVNRTAGFVSELHALAPKLKVVAEENSNLTAADGFSIASDYISRYGSKLVAIYSEDDTVTSGVAKVIKAQHLIGKIRLISINGSEAGIQCLQAGICQADLLQSPIVDGAWTMLYAADYLEGLHPARIVPLATPGITLANIKQFSPGW